MTRSWITILMSTQRLLLGKLFTYFGVRSFHRMIKFVVEVFIVVMYIDAKFFQKSSRIQIFYPPALVFDLLFLEHCRKKIPQKKSWNQTRIKKNFTKYYAQHESSSPHTRWHIGHSWFLQIFLLIWWYTFWIKLPCNNVLREEVAWLTWYFWIKI